MVPEVAAIEHVVVIDGDPGAGRFGSATTHAWADLLDGPEGEPVAAAPSDLATFVYTGGTTGPSKGCMLSHNYHQVLARQIGTCWRRTADDVVWTPLPMFHFNAIVTAVVGSLLFGGSGAISSRFSVSNFWPEMNRTGATITSTLGTMAYLLAHDEDRPEMPLAGGPEANTSLRLLGAAPMPEEVDRIIRSRFGIDTFSGAYGLTEASLVSWQPPGVDNKANAAGVINDEYFDVRVFDDDDHELPRGTAGEIVLRPKRPQSMFEGYWGRPEATVEASRNWWFHTGDIGRIDEDDFLFFVDRKADYLRRRGENISSFEVERILMGHGALADVVVHAVPSELGEDDLKISATLRADATLTRGGSLSLVPGRAPLLRAPPLHRVPGGVAPQPGGPGPEADPAGRGGHRRHVVRRRRRDRDREALTEGFRAGPRSDVSGQGTCGAVSPLPKAGRRSRAVPTESSCGRRHLRRRRSRPTRPGSTPGLASLFDDLLRRRADTPGTSSSPSEEDYLATSTAGPVRRRLDLLASRRYRARPRLPRRPAGRR